MWGGDRGGQDDQSFLLDFYLACLQCFKLYDRDFNILIVPYYFISTCVGIERRFSEGRKGN